jgi:pimeloyl-ACP methyl ester carboxylesterase
MNTRTVSANGLDFGVLELGTGPLALCLHGFPDSAHTWRYLLPALADAGFHAVAPFMRGYAPTVIPADGCYEVGALVADAIALWNALDGDDQAVLIGHDWGAEAAYGAASFAPECWRRVVVLSIPPLALDDRIFGDYEQLRRFFYLYFLRDLRADAVVAANRMAFLDRLWADWSPGYDARDALTYVKACLAKPENLAAAIGYYRADGLPNGKYRREQAALLRIAPQPTLYLHGEADGCIAAHLVADSEHYLAAGSSMRLIADAGHFLHLEKPSQVNEAIVTWITG